MYCGNCGAEVAPSDRFCGRCGAKTPKQAPNAQPTFDEVANQAINSISSTLNTARSAIAIARSTMTEAITEAAVSQIPKHATDADWSVTLDIEESCPLFKTSWYSDEMTFNIRPDGLIWLETTPDDLFELVDFAWDGPNIKQKTISKNSGTTEKKGRLGGAIAGGVVAKGIGTVVGGPLGGFAVTAAGAAIGAMAGSGNTNKHEDTVVETETKEHKSIADITLRSIYSGKIGTISVKGKSRKFSPFVRLSNHISS